MCREVQCSIFLQRLSLLVFHRGVLMKPYEEGPCRVTGFAEKVFETAEIVFFLCGCRFALTSCMWGKSNHPKTLLWIYPCTSVPSTTHSGRTRPSSVLETAQTVFPSCLSWPSGVPVPTNMGLCCPMFRILSIFFQTSTGSRSV